MSKSNEEDIHPHAQKHTCTNFFGLLGHATLIYIFFIQTADLCNIFIILIVSCSVYLCDCQFLMTWIFPGSPRNSPVGLNQVFKIFQNECLGNNLLVDFCLICLVFKFSNCFDTGNCEYSSQNLLFNVQYSHLFDNDRFICSFS